jgi:hypothetical protein
MALKIKWTPQADKGLAIVIEYLEAEWTFREILQLEENINQVANQISLFPDLYQNLKPIKSS